MKLKKILALALTLVLAMSVFAACGEEDSGKRTIRKKKDAKEKLVIGYTIYEPMNYLDDSGELTGFDTEFAKAVCEKLGKEAEFVEINWDTKFVTLDANQIDCIWNGMTISDEVKKNCLVSKPYVKNAQVVVMAKDKIEEYKDLESLKGLKFTAEAGSAGETAIKENGLDANYTEVAAQTDALLAVKGGQADACVIDITMAKSMTAEGTSYADFTYGLELTSEEYGIGFRLEDEKLKDAVDKAIDELAKEGKMAELAAKYELNLAF